VFYQRTGGQRHGRQAEHADDTEQHNGNYTTWFIGHEYLPDILECGLSDGRKNLLTQQFNRVGVVLLKFEEMLDINRLLY
jgi:hypothetical protein